ncbi:MAG: ABC transporter permease [Thaumarchaeota archaeon]|jgi:NitT/TauT family transport system permease protein|nr:ABC transporter permease [Candidatus Geocrenenecus arthurdayi]
MSYNKLILRFSWLTPIIPLLLSWEILARLNIFPEYLFPSFTKTLLSGYILVREGVLWINLLASFVRVIAGFLIGSTMGIALGIVMGYKDVVYRTLHPIFSLLMPIPALGWLPLLILWIGVNEALPITLVFICSFFPVLYNTVSGIRSVDKRYVEMARSLGAPFRKAFFDIVIPLALPSIFTGLRLEAGMAWRTIVAAEMIAIPVGIGALMITSQYLMRVDVIMLCLGVLALMTLTSEKILMLMENKIIKWR